MKTPEELQTAANQNFMPTSGNSKHINMIMLFNRHCPPRTFICILEVSVKIGSMSTDVYCGIHIKQRHL